MNTLRRKTTNSTRIFDLIRKMTPTEKSNFKKLKKKESKENPQFLILFDKLNKMKQLNENTLKKTIPDYHVLISYLEKELLSFLMSSTEDESHARLFLKYYNQALICFERGLYEHAQLLLIKVLQHMIYPNNLIMEINVLQLLIRLKHSEFQNIHPKITTFFKSEDFFQLLKDKIHFFQNYQTLIEQKSKITSLVENDYYTPSFQKKIKSIPIYNIHGIEISNGFFKLELETFIIQYLILTHEYDLAYTKATRLQELLVFVLDKSQKIEIQTDARIVVNTYVTLLEINTLNYFYLNTKNLILEFQKIEFQNTIQQHLQAFYCSYFNAIQIIEKKQFDVAKHLLETTVLYQEQSYFKNKTLKLLLIIALEELNYEEAFTILKQFQPLHQSDHASQMTLLLIVALLQKNYTLIHTYNKFFHKKEVHSFVKTILKYCLKINESNYTLIQTRIYDELKILPPIDQQKIEAFKLLNYLHPNQPKIH